jgi:hypothetical protein
MMTSTLAGLPLLAPVGLGALEGTAHGNLAVGMGAVAVFTVCLWYAWR